MSSLTWVDKLCGVSFREQTALCVSILEKLLQAVEPVHLARNLRVDLQRGLTHPDDSVKSLTLSQVWNFSSHSLSAVHRTPGVMPLLFELTRHTCCFFFKACLV